MIRYVTIEHFSKLSGYTPDAIRTKIKRGVWVPGNEYVRAPDNRVLIDMEGYNRWAESVQAYIPRVNRVS